MTKEIAYKTANISGDSQCCSHERCTRLSLEQSDCRTYCSGLSAPGEAFGDSFTRGRGTDSTTRFTSVLTADAAPSSSHTRSLHWLVHPSPHTALHRLFPLLKGYKPPHAHHYTAHPLASSKMKTMLSKKIKQF